MVENQVIDALSKARCSFRKFHLVNQLFSATPSTEITDNVRKS